MERRQDRRYARRVQVNFRRVGDDETRSGYSINVSPTGIFVGTSRPLAPGIRVVVEVTHGEQSFTVAGKVVHAARVSPLLQRVRPSGMGVRFDQPEEELSALLNPPA